MATALERGEFEDWIPLRDYYHRHTRSIFWELEELMPFAGKAWCTVCPWDAIEMVPTENVAHVVAEIGGPPEYIQENWDRLVGTAHTLAELKAGV